MQNLKVGEYLALWRNYKVSVTEAEPERGRVVEIVREKRRSQNAKGLGDNAKDFGFHFR